MDNLSSLVKHSDIIIILFVNFIAISAIWIGIVKYKYRGYKNNLW